MAGPACLGLPKVNKAARQIGSCLGITSLPNLRIPLPRVLAAQPALANLRHFERVTRHPRSTRKAGSHRSALREAPQDSRMTNSVSKVTDMTSSSPSIKEIRISAAVQPNPYEGTRMVVKGG